jgi:hypothetical protein
VLRFGGVFFFSRPNEKTMATTVIITNSDEDNIRDQLQQCGLETEAFVVDPKLLCDSLTRMCGVDLAAVEMGRLPKIPEGSTTLVDKCAGF